MLTKYICPDGEEILIEQCLKECRLKTRCMHKNILAYIASGRRLWNGIPSVTQLIGGTQQALLEVTKDYANNPDEYIYAIQGTSVHNLIEDDIPRITSEKYGISGKPDSFDTNTGELTDFKNTGYYKVQLAMDGKEDPWEWSYQLNMYRILLEEEFGYKVNSLTIQCLIRDYMESRLKDTKISRRTITLPIPIIENATILAFFLDKKQKLLDAISSGVAEICSEKERWFREKTGVSVKCQSYCPVRRICPHVTKKEGSGI